MAAPLDPHSQAIYQEFATAKAAGNLKGKGLVVNGDKLEFRKLGRLERWGKTIGIGNASVRALAKFSVEGKGASCHEIVEQAEKSSEKTLFVFKSVKNQDVEGLSSKQQARQNNINEALGHLLAKMATSSPTLTNEDFAELENWYPTPAEMKEAFTKCKDKNFFPIILAHYPGARERKEFSDEMKQDFLVEMCKTADSRLAKAALGSLDAKELLEKLPKQQSRSLLEFTISRSDAELGFFIIDKLPLSDRLKVLNERDDQGRSLVDRSKDLKPKLMEARSQQRLQGLESFIKENKLKVDSDFVKQLAKDNEEEIRRSLSDPTISKQAHRLFQKAVEKQDQNVLSMFYDNPPEPHSKS